MFQCILREFLKLLLPYPAPNELLTTWGLTVFTGLGGFQHRMEASPPSTAYHRYV